MFAQNVNKYMYYGGYYDGFPATKSDEIFNNPRPGRANSNFRFSNLKNAAKFTLELIDLRQLKYLPNLDSLLNIVRSNLAAIADSLKEDGINRRVDYVLTSKNSEIRIVNYDNRPKQYIINKGELSELKVEQDTLRIKGFALMGDKNTPAFPGQSTINSNQPFFITLLVNNINDIKNIEADALQKCIDLLKKDITDEYISKQRSYHTYTANYDMRSAERTYPRNLRWLKYSQAGYYDEFVPNVYAGFGYVRGNFVPSFSAGLRYTLEDGFSGKKHLFAMWEPYFIFTRDGFNKLVTDRNDFVTLRYINIPKGKKEGFDFVDNVSLGYLIRRQGNWFEPGTFKLGIPAVRSGWLQLEPELFFNGFFKNFSPSLRLTIHYE